MILVYPKPHLPENEQYTIRLQNKSQRTATAVFYFKANRSLDKPIDQRRPPPDNRTLFTIIKNLT